MRGNLALIFAPKPKPNINLDVVLHRMSVFFYLRIFHRPRPLRFACKCWLMHCAALVNYYHRLPFVCYQFVQNNWEKFGKCVKSTQREMLHHLLDQMVANDWFLLLWKFPSQIIVIIARSFQWHAIYKLTKAPMAQRHIAILCSARKKKKRRHGIVS